MALVVTGSAGFLGRVLVATALGAGHDVIGVDRRPAVPAASGHTHLTADLLDGDPLVAAALATADAVVHLAGCPGVRDDRADVETHRYRDNVLAAAAVLAAVPRSTQVVVSTSSSVYGGSWTGRPSAEGDVLCPRGGYARSKARTEALCRAHLDSGGRVAIARPFTVAGEGQRADMALAGWIAAARAGRPLRVLGSLERTRDITDVRDVARVLLALLDAGAPGPVNVGTGTPHTLGALVEAVGAALGLAVRTRIEPAAPDEVADTLADTDRLRELIGFVPVTDLNALLARQVAATAEPVADLVSA